MKKRNLSSSSRIFFTCALVQFTAVVSDMRGKLAGTVFSKNRSGAIVRTKVTPINPLTNAQSNARALLASLSQAWRALTQAQRDAWNAAVESFKKTNVFGRLVAPSGKNLYTSLNANLSNIAGTNIDEPPSPVSVPTFSTLTATMAKGTPAASLAFTPDPIDASTDVLLFATAGQSPGREFVKSQLRLISVIPGATASPYDFLSDYTDKYGLVPPAGQKVFLKAVPIENTTGQAGVGFQTSVIVST